MTTGKPKRDECPVVCPHAEICVSEPIRFDGSDSCNHDHVHKHWAVCDHPLTPCPPCVPVYVVVINEREIQDEQPLSGV